MAALSCCRMPIFAVVIVESRIRIKPGLHQRQKRGVANAKVGTPVWATVYISVFPVALPQFIYALPTVSRTQWRGVWYKRDHWLMWYLSDGAGKVRHWKRGQFALAPPDAFDVIVLIHSNVFVKRVGNAALATRRFWRCCNPGLIYWGGEILCALFFTIF
jgi:hypothetical protein